MKFSVCLPTGFEGVMHPIPFVEATDFVPLAQLCERLGYDGVWGNDHITTQHYVEEKFPGRTPRFYEVMTVLAFCAAATTRLRVGTAVAVLPMRDPLWLAKQAATLDAMSGGRLDLGLGIGAYREEFAAWAPRLARTAQRGEMLDEGLAMLHALFTEPRTSFDGKYYACRDVAMSPKPAQAPLPIYVGGHNMASVERAARWGRGWLPGWRPWAELAERIATLRARAAELGRDPDSIEVAPQFSVTVGRTPEAAEARYMASDLVAHRKSLAYTGRDLSQQVVANLVGSPDLIREKVAGLAAIGVRHCCGLMFPADTLAEYREQVEWFAEVVRPGG
ncbi:LLM class flavin-dependent oxidoreductase [Roseomonas sp. NAR14]|uniref:LLM class flavin-dependent oxidoreductase n=1 Tax=Roseomonas acroporae TaxID=2937791 RepID=A0A9X1Y8X7_9PROT|nr:TIGR03619 family F420-dependent LLM class oxidoreductase [Roseomonas acroporae]MCK8785688.1 LLM class flavin-dependent oxidoreductase [Roseomonas acroporae]